MCRLTIQMIDCYQSIKLKLGYLQNGRSLLRVKQFILKIANGSHQVAIQAYRCREY